MNKLEYLYTKIQGKSGRQNSILQVDLLKILKNSRTRNENFDIFLDPKESEYNIFGPIPEPPKITVVCLI